MFSYQVAEFVPRNGHFNDSQVVWTDLVLAVDIGDAFFREFEISVRLYVFYEESVIRLLIWKCIAQMRGEDAGKCLAVAGNEEISLIHKLSGIPVHIHCHLSGSS